MWSPENYTIHKNQTYKLIEARYPFHYHLTGVNAESYIQDCAVHDSNFRYVLGLFFLAFVFFFFACKCSEIKINFCKLLYTIVQILGIDFGSTLNVVFFCIMILHGIRVA